ncbi:Oidioi.mRNA.OKI2018_I69.chr2.g4830.t1.cds [Oikopleura dioica]|uniref:Oidioi.mRNA.OKI2018_I69.chr2.g4830.t1.cds n=1 Tax=Oikopleura dioica TaxID=34765 RepID=A0ABN7SYI1_OIKDI|nr:Oidioi.mRNA.OKI2018_I69.chr2.g4830.t1.cds [Oikopleura dioica]
MCQPACSEEAAQDIGQSEVSNPGGSNYPSVLTTKGGEFKYRSGISGGSNDLVARYLCESNDFQSITDKNARDLGQAKREHEAYQNDFKKWQKRAGEKKDVKRKKEQIRANLDNLIKGCMRKDEHFEKQLRELVVNTDGRHAQLMTEIHHSQAETDAKKDQLVGIEERMEYAERKIDEKRFALVREKCSTKELVALEARKLRRENDARKIEKELKEIKLAKKEVEDTIVAKKADVEKWKKEAENAIQIAESHCERPTKPLTKKLLTDEREKISRDLKINVKSSDKDYEDIKRTADHICRGNKYEGECKIIPEKFDLNA